MDKRYIAEFIGTFVFSLGINMSTLYTDGSQIPNLFSIVAALFCGITISRSISGGHVNGAVSLGFFFENKNLKDFIMYFASQIAGVFCSCFLSWLLYHGQILTFSSINYNLKGIFIAEAFCTFVFVYNILTQSNNRFTTNQTLSTFIVVIGLFTSVNLTSVLSAGCVNPSLAIGHTLSRMLLGVGVNDFEFSQFVMYLLGELAGGCIAGYAYMNFYKEIVDSEKDEAKVIDA